MYCPHCGTKNPDGAKFCGDCGKAMPAAQAQSQPQAQQPATPPPLPSASPPPQPAPPQPVAAAPETPAPQAESAGPRSGRMSPARAALAELRHEGPMPQIRSHMVLAIISTLCCGCFPLGIVAIIFATQVNAKVAAGDVAGARVASSRALKCAIIAIIVGIICGGIGLLIQLAPMLDQM